MNHLYQSVPQGLGAWFSFLALCGGNGQRACPSKTRTPGRGHREAWRPAGRLCLSKGMNWRTKKKMHNGNPFAHISNVKGIAVDLPFCRFRYVTIEGESGRDSISGGKATALPRLHGEVERCEPPVRRIEYAPPAQVTTLGPDPLVSSASVIHELLFGRMRQASPGPAGGGVYPVLKEHAPHALDLYV